MNEESFYKAYQGTKVELGETINRNKSVAVQWIYGEESNQGEKLFDKTKYYDQLKILHSGHVENNSLRWGKCNVNTSLRDFYGRKVELCQLTKHVLDSKIKLINVSGPANVGKTALVFEFAKYLSMRDTGYDKIYYFNFKSINKMSKATEFLESIDH